MASTESPPDDWVVETDETRHNEFMGRDFTSVVYRQEGTRSGVYINEVIDGDNVWRYNVHRSGHSGGQGTADDIEAAREMAYTFMNEAGAEA